MRTTYRFSIAPSSEVCRELAALGVTAKQAGTVLTFEVDESDPRFPSLATWAKRRRAAEFAISSFSRDEILAASWVELVPDWHSGYPQPHPESCGYREATYDTLDYCVTCGIGLRQNAPFQMLGEPKWGARSITQLYWVYDEFFVTPALMANVFTPAAVASRAVLAANGHELETARQLVIEREEPVVVAGLARSLCASCGREKYAPSAVGSAPALVNQPGRAINAVRTLQYFGSGAAANQRIFVSRDIASALLMAGAKGVRMRPVEPRETAT